MVNNASIDLGKIQTAIRLGVPIAITTYTLPKQMESYINDVVVAFLRLLNKEHIQDYVTYCINELTTNAKKANTKRAYFKERGLDINNDEDYTKGMASFKQDTLSNITYYLNMQKNLGLYVKVSMQVKNKTIIVEVANNTMMTVTEFKRIWDKLTRAKLYSNVDEAFKTLLDDSEGAGLGLVIMILMLKKMGIPPDSFSFASTNGMTTFKLEIPQDITMQKQLDSLTDDIVQYIDKIPQFPQKILAIQNKINQPNAEMLDIAMLISNDVALTTDLLKLVNSASFGLSNCMHVSEAVKFIGLRGIQNLLYSIGTMQVLEMTSDEQKELWNRAYKTAYFAYNLAKMMGKRAIMEDVYVCGLLHDLGRIVFTSMYPNLLIKLNELQTQKNIPRVVIDTLLSDVEHSSIGVALAKKWNLPVAIVNTIKYYQAPEDAPEDFRSIIRTVSFADKMIHFLLGEISYEQIPQEQLQSFKITSEAQFQRLTSQFEAGFQRDQQAEAVS